MAETKATPQEFKAGLPDVITRSEYPDLFEMFKKGCKFDTSSIPKHGSGYVTPEVGYEGNIYIYNMELVWDYSWGIEEWCESDGAWEIVCDSDDRRVEIVISCYESQRSEILSLLKDQFPVELESENRFVMQ